MAGIVEILAKVNLFAGERDLSGAGQFRDTEAVHEHEKFFHFTVGAGHFDGERFRLHVNDLGAENIADLHHLRARFRSCRHAEEHEFAVHVLFVTEILHVDHVDEFFEQFGDLLEHLVVAANDDCHAGGGGVERWADVKSIDIKAAAAEHSGYAGKHPELVFDEDGNCVAHESAGAEILDGMRQRVNPKGYCARWPADFF